MTKEFEKQLEKQLNVTESNWFVDGCSIFSGNDIHRVNIGFAKNDISELVRGDPNCEVFPGPREARANACLWAASKDMYKTLTILTLEFDKVHADCKNREFGELMGHLSKEIKLVLAKARGEIKNNEERL